MSKPRKSPKAASSKTVAKAENHAFKAETARLLQLLIHSVYSDREVFLRELISNAADACDRLRYEAIQNPKLTEDEPHFRINIIVDPAAKTLSVEDNGVGMDHDALVADLGVIARSGTRAFIDRIAAAGEGGNLIGQFGVGFYAAFMVAREVEVVSRAAGSGEVWRWLSAGGESFSVEPVTGERARMHRRGTRVTLHLAEDAAEFLEVPRIERVIKTYSGHVPVPISLVEVKEGKPGEARAVTDASALWRKPKSQVSPEAYKEFYGHVSGQFDEPALAIHYRAEGRHEYAVLLFVPSAPPFDLFDPERRGRVRLYVRRVYITDQAELLAPYLRFVRGVIDSEDMPLNISREMLQNNPLVEQIRKAVTNRVLSELGRLAEAEPEKFIKIWESFGAVIKEGLYEDAERRDELYELTRFRTTRKPEGWRSLKDYVADLKDNQTAIYTIAGESLDQLAASPQLEGFRARGIEVLLLSDPVDSFWTATALGFAGKPFRSVTQGAADLDAIPLKESAAKDESKDKKAEPGKAKLATLIAMVKETLGSAVSDVALSQRLTSSPCCLVAPAGGPDRQLEKLLARHAGQAALSAPVLEINPDHALIAALAESAAAGGNAEPVKSAVWMLFDQARIAEGEGPHDAAAFCNRLTDILVKAMAAKSG
ncbi:MAG: molecular chaperone HtpG [Hyphomicrobiales bacterium]|nr:molecular chaperone HtpG [Hyphomicrobiales bacterium]